jgi:Mn2+/Fe2+ NRAMP family transporter
VIALAFLVGLGMLFAPIDPIKALFWSAVLNGVIAVPLMMATMIVASSREHLGRFVATFAQKVFGWTAAAVMAAAAVAMFVL